MLCLWMLPTKLHVMNYAILPEEEIDFRLDNRRASFRINDYGGNGQAMGRRSRLAFLGGEKSLGNLSAAARFSIPQ